jgi:uncharacterized protein
MAAEQDQRRKRAKDDGTKRQHGASKLHYPHPMIEDEATRIRVEAAAFRRLVQHLQSRDDVQNIDLMNLAGFCRNCLAKWFRAAAAEEGVELDEMAVRGHIHGVPYEEWKARTQK